MNEHAQAARDCVSTLRVRLESGAASAALILLQASKTGLSQEGQRAAQTVLDAFNHLSLELRSAEAFFDNAAKYGG